MAALHRFLAHRGLVTALVVLLVLSTPLVWLGASQGHFDPLLYSAVIEADVEFNAECNMVSRQITSESGRQDRVTELEVWSTETLLDHVSPHRSMWLQLADKGWAPAEIEALAQDAGLHGCLEHAGKFSTHSKLLRNWFSLITSFSTDAYEMTYEYGAVQGKIWQMPN